MPSSLDLNRPTKQVKEFHFGHPKCRPYKNRVTGVEAAAYPADEDIELHGSRGPGIVRKGDYVVFSLLQILGMEKERFEDSYGVAADIEDEWKKRKHERQHCGGHV